MPDVAILRDTREKKPYSFSRYPCQIEDVELTTGDYCLAGDGDWKSDDVYSPEYAVERKNADDFLNSITWERDRFEDELERADSFDYQMPVVVERPWEFFMEDQHKRDVHPNSIRGTIKSHTALYNAEYFFTRDRQKAAQLTFEWLEWRSDLLTDSR